MDIHLSIAIMHYPDDGNRRAYLRDIKRELERGSATYQVIIDRKHLGVWWTAQHAWCAYPETATHHLVLQDDVQLCRNFVETVNKVVSAVPNQCISLYSPRKAILVAREYGANWVIGSADAVFGQAMILPTPMARDFLFWQALHIDGRQKWDDSRLAAYLYKHDLNSWCTAPSLVEHIGWQHSVCGNPAAPGGNPRIAAWFELDPIGVDWSRTDNAYRVPGVAQIAALKDYHD